MSSSWDDARRCSTHKMAGKELSRTVGGRGTSLAGSKIITLECPESGCPIGTWIVQVRPDGTIPEPTTERDKQYPAIPNWRRAAGQNMIENIQEQVAREQAAGA